MFGLCFFRGIFVVAAYFAFLTAATAADKPRERAMLLIRVMIDPRWLRHAGRRAAQSIAGTDHCQSAPLICS